MFYRDFVENLKVEINMWLKDNEYEQEVRLISMVTYHTVSSEKIFDIFKEKYDFEKLQKDGLIDITPESGDLDYDKIRIFIYDDKYLKIVIF